MSRAYTPDEAREKLLRHIKVLVRYWATVKTNEGPHSVEDRLDGLAFSILSTLDGASIGIPAFDLVPAPHPEDKEYHMDNGENWYEPVVINECQLHEHYSGLTLRSPVAPAGAPSVLPESMSRDEMLAYYSEYANMVCKEVLVYQKRIRELEAALLSAQGCELATVASPATADPQQRYLLIDGKMKPDSHGNWVAPVFAGAAEQLKENHG